MGSKCCNTCKIVKDFGSFSKNKNAKDSLQYDCIECGKEMKRQWRSRNKERHDSYMKKYREDNHELTRIRGKFYRDNNIEKEKIRCKQYKDDNPIARKLEASRARARKHNAVHPEHDTEFEKVFIETRLRIEKCCGIKHCVNHILPLEKGGYHHHGNLQVLTTSLQKSRRKLLNHRHENMLNWTDLPKFLIEKMRESEEILRELFHQKKCYNCGEVKHYTLFYSHPSTNDKISAHCMSCSKILNHQWINTNKEYVLAKRLEYNSNNRELLRIKANTYRSNNLEKVKARTNLYRRNNPQLGSYHTSKRRAMKKNATHPDHNPSIEKVFIDFRMRISKCVGSDFHVDHILPLNCGGFHHHGNLQVVPATLNESKRDRLDFEHPAFIHWTELPTFLLENIKLVDLPE